MQLNPSSYCLIVRITRIKRFGGHIHSQGCVGDVGCGPGEVCSAGQDYVRRVCQAESGGVAVYWELGLCFAG